MLHAIALPGAKLRKVDRPGTLQQEAVRPIRESQLETQNLDSNDPRQRVQRHRS
jgi:hypothetical protein